MVEFLVCSNLGMLVFLPKLKKRNRKLPFIFTFQFILKLSNALNQLLLTPDAVVDFLLHLIRYLFCASGWGMFWTSPPVATGHVEGGFGNLRQFKSLEELGEEGPHALGG